MNPNVFKENEKEAYFYARALYKLSNLSTDATTSNFNDVDEKEQNRYKVISSAFVRLVADKMEYNNLKDRLQKIEEQL